uniref:Uncharacterized protein n=2 Tax=Brassica oleracea TaxID=3712 RepID=A0A0D3EC69_BRAOL
MLMVVDVEDVRKRQPEMLLATDRFPSKRVNIYSTVDRLLWSKDVLNGTPKMARLMGSCFGSLFQIPVRRLSMGKVVHR